MKCLLLNYCYFSDFLLLSEMFGHTENKFTAIFFPVYSITWRILQKLQINPSSPTIRARNTCSRFQNHRCFKSSCFNESFHEYTQTEYIQYTFSSRIYHQFGLQYRWTSENRWSGYRIQSNRNQNWNIKVWINKQMPIWKLHWAQLLLYWVILLQAFINALQLKAIFSALVQQHTSVIIPIDSWPLWKEGADNYPS